MSDHLLYPAMVRVLLDAPAAALTLAVDRDLANPLLDMDDATKVALGADGAILRIGKTLARFDAIDTGLFRATPALAAAIEAALADGGTGSLSEGVQRLAARGAAMTVEIEGARWLDVDDAVALAKAEGMLG
jgi:choline kinase